MVIECKYCSRRFKLNELLLKPSGSKVRCSRCNAVFNAFPPLQRKSPNPEAEGQRSAPAPPPNAEVSMRLERRKHPRLPVSIPVLCDVLDSDGKAKDFQLGAIKDISKGGVKVELFSRLASGEVSLFFLNAENQGVQVRANVVHSKIQDSLKARSGLLLSGLPSEIAHFVTQVINTHTAAKQKDLPARV